MMHIIGECHLEQMPVRPLDRGMRGKCRQEFCARLFSQS